ncbi:hypothetical protein IVA98_00455 [Bradyrhizobium sp. 160]|nr:hypothetical protein [Bradyrhizobium sp. 160]
MRHLLDDPHRPTRDLDLLGFGERDPQLTPGCFKEIGSIQAEGSLTFNTDTFEIDTVRDDSGSKLPSGLSYRPCATSSTSRSQVVRSWSGKTCSRNHFA